MTDTDPAGEDPDESPDPTGDDIADPTGDDIEDPEATDPDDIIRDATGNPDAEPGLGRVPMPSD